MWRNKFERVLTVQAVCLLGGFLLGGFLLGVPTVGWAQGASASGASASGLTAGEALPGWGVYALDEAKLLWQHSENAAGVDLDSTRTRGFSAFQFVHQGGDFHRVQEGRQTNEVGFVSERYQRIGKYLAGYGRFEFLNGRTTHRAWSDVVRSYWSNPFLSGSSVPGSYDTQQFAFQARVGTVDLHGFRYGVKLDYTVRDLSRLRDPRSRSRRLDYQITPSVTYSFGKMANSGTVTNFAILPKE